MLQSTVLHARARNHARARETRTQRFSRTRNAFGGGSPSGNVPTAHFCDSFQLSSGKLGEAHFITSLSLYIMA